MIFVWKGVRAPQNISESGLYPWPSQWIVSALCYWILGKRRKLKKYSCVIKWCSHKNHNELWVMNLRFLIFQQFKIHALGAPAAQLEELAPRVQRLCPHRSSEAFEAELRPFAACHPPSLPLIPSPVISLSGLMKPWQGQSKSKKVMQQLKHTGLLLRSVQVFHNAT